MLKDKIVDVFEAAISFSSIMICTCLCKKLFDKVLTTVASPMERHVFSTK